MIDVGVSDISIYIPQLYLSHGDLADARGVPVGKYHEGLGNNRMSILPEWEDSVTMAANAATQLLKKTGTDPDEIQQMVVSTESGVDHSKPVASFVQGLLNMGSRCRIYEIKHACYGGTAGVINSIDWIYRNNSPKKKALVIMTDTARYGFQSAGEPTQGAGAVALLIEKDPKLFSVDTSTNGVFSKDVFDFWRPTGHRVPVVDGRYSIECYLTALDESVAHFRSNLGIARGELFEKLDYLVYHMPFANMAKKAHRHLVTCEYPDLSEEERKEIYLRTFSEMVKPGLLGAREVGNIYTGSVYMGLVSILESEGEAVKDKKVGLFSYGSGCGAEFLVCHMKNGIGDILRGLQFQQQLQRREQVTFEKYVEVYSKERRETKLLPEDALKHKDAYTRFVFTGFEDHKRKYS